MAFPVYVPIALGMWAGFVATDMQRNTDEMLEGGREQVEAIMGEGRNSGDDTETDR